MNKKLIILSIIALILLGIIGGMSYAYFTIGDKEGTQEVITSGTMSLLLTDGQEVIANNLIPGQYVEKTFKVKNTGNVDTRYDVYFSEVINTFVDKTDLVYTLTSNDGGYNTTGEIQVPDTETKIVNQYLISPNEEHTYTLRITFKLKQTIQNVNMGRTFTAKININEFNLNSSEHLLKLIDVNGNEVDKQIIVANQNDYTLSLSNANLTNSTNIYCNNGGIPTISGNTLNVSGITNDTECKISNDIVDTFTNKLTTTKTGIVMTNDQSDVSRMQVLNGKEVVLDLNGKKIESIGVDETSTTWNINHNVLSSSSKLTINDSVGTGGVYTGTTNRALETLANGHLVINGGNYNGRQAIYISGSNSKVIINGGNYSSKLYETLAMSDSNKNSELLINDGYFINSINNMPVINANKNIENNFLEINGGNYNVSNGGRILIGAVNVTINDGYFFADNNSRTISMDASANNKNWIINGGIFEGGNDNQIEFNCNSCNMVINGGTFYSPSYGGATTIAFYPYNSESVLTVNGGDFIDEWPDRYGRCIYSFIWQGNGSGGVININGGNYKSKGWAIDNNRDAVININNANVNSIGSNPAIINRTNGVINICKANIYGNKTIFNQSSSGYIYYHTNAFGSVTPTFGGTSTANIQVKDSVCS